MLASKYMIIIDIDPIGKPRMTKADAWKKRSCVLRYWEFKYELVKQCEEAGYELEEKLDLVFFIPMPKSWSKKKRKAMHMQPHKQKPDIDNLCKSFMDALASEDSKVWCITAQKYWSDRGSIEILTEKDQMEMI